MLAVIHEVKEQLAAFSRSSYEALKLILEAGVEKVELVSVADEIGG